MAPQRDPVERSADDSVDLYDVSTWEPRSAVDRFATLLYAGLNYGLRTLVLVATVAITLSLLATPAVLVADEPLLGVFFGLSVVPALVLAAYIWYADITTSEPLKLLVATFLLAILFATFAGIVNEIGRYLLSPLPAVIGTLLFFYLVVGPIEEGVKLLAVRVLAFRSKSFDAVIDGAVYGAVAGLGFAAIENAIYISGTLAELDSGMGLFTAATGIATVRALVGPGHVIYSAIAGYYLGLAKFNPEHAGPLVVKGLLVASLFHATYNATVQVAPGLIAGFHPAIGPEIAFVGYVILYDLVVGFYLYRKISRYRRTYSDVRVTADADDITPERTEFDPSHR
ncbi:PrsW family intramembrane metalloprotease [Halobacteria archaeon AArc-m2/3/4]|uniref:PrsW family intramembrane metalloprotease n=1 Tax=Natronoglomus mannanivorans TaxID=2979990 RepID=A0AAP2Z244_9EURY|nr:PrsW family intramembrane metalloprotease [Halobacteria archaeon AArc-xg1-1]MCU4974360.1 PrsW family intramembrane metalloprotease [Halobacteria archaeon AArc-m2/3/4]